jgi:hypothetical protein
MTYFDTTLASATFDRAQAIAENFQEYRIKYVKLIFRPAADTFAPGTGPIPQLYFQMNKYATLPNGASQQALLDMGCRPIRFDDKNITRAYKPVVLLGADQTSQLIPTLASAVKVTPWLTTNAFAQTPGNAFSPSAVQHWGCVWYVTRPNPTGPASNYNVDVEVVFQFRRPLSLASATTEPYLTLNGEEQTIVTPETGGPA